MKAHVISDTKRPTLHQLIQDNVKDGSIVFTDNFKLCRQLKFYYHQSVKHSVGEYVNEMVHVNGIESFWAILNKII